MNDAYEGISGLKSLPYTTSSSQFQFCSAMLQKQAWSGDDSMFFLNDQHTAEIYSTELKILISLFSSFQAGICRWEGAE